MFNMNKKGAEMTIGTIVMIILALVVLVVLIFGFTSGWSNLWNNIVGFGGGTVNVQTVVQACQVACSTSSTYDYCTRLRSVVFSKDDKTLNKDYTCKQLEGFSQSSLSACSNIDCTGGNDRGLCSGTPTIDCSLQNNKGKTLCEEVLGCGWTPTVNSQNANDGECKLKGGVVCTTYNNDKSSCDKLGCQWQPAI